MTPASKHRAGGKSAFVSSSLDDQHLHIQKWSLKSKDAKLAPQITFLVDKQLDCFQLQQKRFLLNFATEGFSLLGCLPNAFSILQALFAADTHVMLLWLGSKRKSMLNSKQNYRRPCVQYWNFSKLKRRLLTSFSFTPYVNEIQLKDPKVVSPCNT